MLDQIKTGRRITLQTAAAAYRKLGYSCEFGFHGVTFEGERMSDREFLIMAMSDFQVA